MARTSGATLSTSIGKPCSLARYISPSNSSRTGQKSFSNASRLENIAFLRAPEDAPQLSNEGLTLPAGTLPGIVAMPRRIRPRPRNHRMGRATGLGRRRSVRRHEDRQAEPREVMQRLVDADQRPEPRVLLVDAEMRGHETLGAVNGDVNGEIDESDEPEFWRHDQDQQ